MARIWGGKDFEDLQRLMNSGNQNASIARFFKTTQKVIRARQIELSDMEAVKILERQEMLDPERPLRIKRVRRPAAKRIVKVTKEKILAQKVTHKHTNIKCGAVPSAWSSESQRIAETMWLDGDDTKTIAKALDVAESVVCKHFRRPR